MVSSFFLSIIIFIYLCFVNLILIIVASSDSESPTNLQDKFQEEYSRLIEEMSTKYPLNVKQTKNYEFRNTKYELKSKENKDIIPPLTEHDSKGIKNTISSLILFRQNHYQNQNFYYTCGTAVHKLIELLQTMDLNHINTELNNRYSKFLVTLTDYNNLLPGNLKKEEFITSK